MGSGYITYVMAADLDAVLPVTTLGPYGVAHWYGQGRVVTTTQSGMVSEYYLLKWVGMHSPHRKVEGLVLSVLTFIRLLRIWLTD